jgi:nicotinate-nucleotide adenylyltransferase
MNAGPAAARIGVMGGTFDPIHHGHLVAASEVGYHFSLDEVIFVPTGQPWQKKGRRVSPSEDRYLMTVIATASNPRFSVSRVDIDRPGPTYTIDTLRDLRLQRGPDAEFFFITGADALEKMMTWQDADELFKLAHFVGCTRPGHQLSDAGSGWRRASRSGTWYRTGSCNTSRKGRSTGNRTRVRYVAECRVARSAPVVRRRYPEQRRATSRGMCDGRS